MLPAHKAQGVAVAALEEERPCSDRTGCCLRPATQEGLYRLLVLLGLSEVPAFILGVVALVL